MADYRFVWCRMWTEDEWFASLSAEFKVVWIYLFTNEHASVSGLYKIRDDQIALETGVPVRRVRSALEHFTADGKIGREGWLVWVKKMRRYQSSKSEKIRACIEHDLDTISDCPLKRLYLATYGMDTVSIGSRARASETETCTETNSDTDTDDEDRTCGPASIRDDPLLSILASTPNYPFDARKDTELIADCQADFPSVNAHEVLTDYRAWVKQGHPINGGRPRQRIRNFFKNARKWAEQDKSKHEDVPEGLNMFGITGKAPKKGIFQ